MPAPNGSDAEGSPDFLRQRGDDRGLARAVTQLSEDAFLKVWDHPDDADYDRL